MADIRHLLPRIDRLMIGTKEDIDRYAEGSFEDSIKPAQAFRDDLIQHLFGEKKNDGHFTPWRSLHDRFRFRPGELTIWSGPSGEGKSLITTQCMLSIVESGGQSAIASLELHPYETLARAAMQFHGYDRPLLTHEMAISFLDAMESRLWLYAETGDVETKRMLALSRYVRVERKIDHLVIDSLVKCGIDDADYRAEKNFINTLQNIAKQTGLHIHLVTHKRKGGQPGEIMRKEDVSGTQKITDLADNVILINRNRRKEEEANKINKDPEIMAKPDTWLRIDKQRHGSGWEGIAGLWFESGHRFVQHGRM